MKIVFFEVEKWEEEKILSSFQDHGTVLTEESLDTSNAEKYKDAEVISTFIYSTLSGEVLEKLPNLKYIATRSMGFDHIDLPFCKKNNILVSNVPNYGGHTVAEHAFALMLALSRRIVESVERTRSGDFTSENLTGFDLFGKTLGVLGTGHIGKNVADLGLSFGMKVIAFNLEKEEELISKGVEFLSLEEVLSNSDIVTLHLPHTKDTEHIINMENIQSFKRGSILINTARGALVQTQAILYGLENGILKGAGLDVLEEEKLIREEAEVLSRRFIEKADYKTDLMNHVLIERRDVIVTPHNAFNSNEALEQILNTTIANVESYINGSPINVIEQ